MTTFSVWAPGAQTVELAVGAERRPLAAGTRQGWWELAAPDLAAGTDYAYVLDGSEPLPDPRSRWQPAGVHGPSRLVDPAQFPWTDAGWRGMPLAGSVVYELHVGTFTPEGTFDAAIGHLDHLADLGVTLVELLPVNAFPGERGWGYDGVDLFAVHDPYGGPAGLARFVDACHARGLGVLIDAVYNHLGPAGNYLSRFGPYFTETHATPWGQAVNLDAPGSDEVRSFILGNALMWLRDYHCDGLRLDAVHELRDDRALTLLEELSVAVDELSAHVRRPLTLIAESDRNDPRTVRSRESGGLGLDAQWADDIHHALHALLTGERQGYYVDFGSLATAAHALESAFVHDGGWSTFRGRGHGRPVDRQLLPGHRLLGYLQTHDQVGNRATGERTAALMSEGLLKVGAALVLTSAFTPMLLMGEEWGAGTPWQFFSDHDPELGGLVSEGRRAEFGEHGWEPGDVPDPQDRATFERSKLDWAEPGREPHARLLDWHRKLIALRRSRQELTDGRLDRVQVTYDEDARWLVVRRGSVAVACNLAADRQRVPVPGSPLQALLASTPGFLYGPGFAELDGESVVVLALA